jgi:hypothetical protein
MKLFFCTKIGDKINFKPHFKHMVFQFQSFNLNFSFDQNGGFGAHFCDFMDNSIKSTHFYNFNFIVNCQILTNNIIKKQKNHDYYHFSKNNTILIKSIQH